MVTIEQARNQEFTPVHRENHTLKGALIFIGGSEDKTGEMNILRVVASHVQPGSFLSIATIGSEIPDERYALYKYCFSRLGIESLAHFNFANVTKSSEKAEEMLSRSSVLFITGGKQTRITETADTYDLGSIIHSFHDQGGVIAGTSAGASALGEVMPNMNMIETGLGLVPELLIDQHFTRLSRLTRLQHAIANYPDKIGVGVDEDTAVIYERNTMSIAGTGSVFVVTQDLLQIGQEYIQLRSGDVFDLTFFGKRERELAVKE